jgi:hypothetical protein
VWERRIRPMRRGVGTVTRPVARRSILPSEMARRLWLVSLVAVAVLALALCGLDVAGQSPTPAGPPLGTLDAAVHWLGNHGFEVGQPATSNGQTVVTATRAGATPADQGTICRLVVSGSGLALASLDIDVSAPSAGQLAVDWTAEFATSGLGFMAWALSAGPTGAEARTVDLGDRSLSVSVAPAGAGVRAEFVVQSHDAPAPSDGPRPSPETSPPPDAAQAGPDLGA